MKKEKSIVIILGILLLIILIIVISIVLILKKEIKNNLPDEEVIIEKELDTVVEKVSARNNFYIVKNCVSKYYTYYNSIYNIEDVSSDEEKVRKENIEAVYNMLDEEYIKYKGITTDNFTTMLPAIKQNKINITDMYVSQKTEHIYVYLVYGNLIDTSNVKVQDFSMIVKVDMKNRTYSVLLEDYIKEKYPNIKSGDYIEINYPKEIEINDYNIFDYKSIDEDTYIGDLFENLKNNMLFNRQVMYNSLNEEYKVKRFPTFESFQKYIKDNIRKISVMKLTNYKKNINGDQVQYICFDNNGNYYIINENYVMDCDFILDTYTIDLPEFLSKYESSDENIKIGLNLEKIREAINVKDFQYVYNKMDKTFRDNTFKSYSDFEMSFKSKLFEDNTFKYEKIEKRGSVYSIKVIISNKKDSKVQSKEMRVIMKLTDTTDYSISFSFEE